MHYRLTWRWRSVCKDKKKMYSPGIYPSTGGRRGLNEDPGWPGQACRTKTKGVCKVLEKYLKSKNWIMKWWRNEAFLVWLCVYSELSGISGGSHNSAIKIKYTFEKPTVKKNSSNYNMQPWLRLLNKTLPTWNNLSQKINVIVCQIVYDLWNISF